MASIVLQAVNHTTQLQVQKLASPATFRCGHRCTEAMVHRMKKLNKRSHTCSPSGVHLFSFRCSPVLLPVYTGSPTGVHWFSYWCTPVLLPVYTCSPSGVHLFSTSVHLFFFQCLLMHDTARFFLQ